MIAKTLELFRNNRPFQVAGGIIGTLLLGALGSGLWELVLRDTFLWMGNITLTFISSIWGGYVDLLHRDIGKLHRDWLTFPLFAMAMTLLLFGPWLMLIRLLRRITRAKEKIAGKESHEDISPEKALEELRDIRKKSLRLLIPFAIFSTLSYSILAWQTTYTRNTANWAERSIKIVRPYVTNHEYVFA